MVSTKKFGKFTLTLPSHKSSLIGGDSMSIAWLKNQKQVEIKCPDKKCMYNKNRFIIKPKSLKNIIGNAIHCPSCNRSIKIKTLRFKRKNMK